MHRDEFHTWNFGQLQISGLIITVVNKLFIRDGPLFFYRGGGEYQKLLKKLFAQSKRVKRIVFLKFSGKKKLFAKEISTTHILREKQNRNFNFIIHLT